MGGKGERMDTKTLRGLARISHPLLHKKRGLLAGSGLCIAVLCCIGCGYTTGFRLPEGIETIHVKVFENKTFYRGLDFDITQAVKREVLARTDLKVVREGGADIIFSGTVDAVEEFVLRKGANDVAQEMEIRLTISVVAKDRKGETIFQVTKLNRSVTYNIVLGEDERLARSRALREVAEELVYRLAESWGWEKKNDKPEKPEPE